MKVSMATTLTLIATVVVGNPTAGYGGTVELRGNDHSTGIVQYEAALRFPGSGTIQGRLLFICELCEASHDRKPRRLCSEGYPEALTVWGTEGIKTEVMDLIYAKAIDVSEIISEQGWRVWGEVRCDTTGWPDSSGGTRYAVRLVQSAGDWNYYRLHGGIEDAVDWPGQEWYSVSGGGGATPSTGTLKLHYADQATLTYGQWTRIVDNVTGNAVGTIAIHAGNLQGVECRNSGGGAGTLRAGDEIACTNTNRAPGKTQGTLTVALGLK